MSTESALDMIDAVARALSELPAGNGHEDNISLLRAARTELHTMRLARGRSVMTTVARQIANVRSARTVDDLVSAIPVETTGLGYERSMFSWISDERWVPQSSHTMSGPRESQEMLAAGGPPYARIRELNEVDLVRKRQAILVVDGGSNGRMHPTITPISRSVTYIAAPVVARERVMGMLHADRNIDTGLTDEFDRDLLNLFCQNIGIALDRVLDHDDSTVGALPAGSDAHWIEALTERERDVLRLLANGLTNAQIGARLYISEETTKTHVKKLLRKMGVSNRSQAGAKYHRHNT
ncbi:LuxR C-terminal-related transcriptional regulator [Rhodococcus erythropolis]|uniref:helix-turn-helix transcriptional regulator n=1 Tax=Rhodococcus erythropolis TaxID=1833 RepID=UPI00379B025A